MKENCIDSLLLVPETVLYIVDFSNAGVVATAVIKVHVVENSTLVHMVVATTEALRQSVAEKASLTSGLSAERVKVYFFKDDKANLLAEVSNQKHSNGIMQDQLDFLNTRRGVILREAAGM